MVLICLTASHKNADFTVLEALASADAHAMPSVIAGHQGVHGAVVVATCNRFEAYVDVADVETADAAALAAGAVADALGSAGASDDIAALPLQALTGEAAAEHLFAVSAGLESVVIGEGQIAGQVRRSLSEAQGAGTTSPDLERLFQRASETQRGVKNRTGLGEAGRSIVRLALDLASDRIHDWTTARVLLIGTGRFAAASLAALRDRGVTHIEVSSPSGRAARFAHSHDLPAVDRRDLALAAASADVIVTCTSAETFVVDASLLSEGRSRLAATHSFGETHDVAAMHAAHAAAGIGAADIPASMPAASGCPVDHASLVASAPVAPHAEVASHAAAGEPTRDERPGCPVAADGAHVASCPVEHGRASQLVIDMGLPRNVDPDVAGVHGVELLDLETIRLHAPLEHLTATDDARAIVRKAARTFSRVSEENRLAPAVTALREHVFEAMDAELVRVRRRGTEVEQAAAEQALRHFAGVLLHKPSVRARELAADGRHDDYLEGLEALFGIDGIA